MLLSELVATPVVRHPEPDDALRSDADPAAAPPAEPALLRPAAEEAARQYKYAPAMLGGEPTSVVATVKFNFRLN